VLALDWGIIMDKEKVVSITAHSRSEHPVHRYEPKPLTGADLLLATQQAMLRDLETLLIRYRSESETCDIVRTARKATVRRISETRRSLIRHVVVRDE
jgi:hypothetical protein